jgi:hypothetical protein
LSTRNSLAQPFRRPLISRRPRAVTSRTCSGKV